MHVSTTTQGLWYQRIFPEWKVVVVKRPLVNMSEVVIHGPHFFCFRIFVCSKYFDIYFATQSSKALPAKN